MVLNQSKWVKDWKWLSLSHCMHMCLFSEHITLRVHITSGAFPGQRPPPSGKHSCFWCLLPCSGIIGDFFWHCLSLSHAVLVSVNDHLHTTSYPGRGGFRIFQWKKLIFSFSVGSKNTKWQNSIMSIWVESFLTEMGSGQWCIRIDTNVAFCYRTLGDVVIVDVNASQSYFLMRWIFSLW